MSNFDTAIASVMDHEGGYVNDPKDPGGETKYGISKRSYPDLDIKNLTEEWAKEIYKRDWWEKYGYSRIYIQQIATKVFDMSVNMGASQAHKIVQRATWSIVGYESVIDDGVLGDKTISAINTCGANLMISIKSELAGYYRLISTKNPELSKFLKGWLKRAYD